MFTAAPVDDLVRFYNRPREQTINGLWSVLVTPSAEYSADFGRKYFEIFNGISGGYWHLAICAKRNEDGSWLADDRLQLVSDTIRRELQKADRSVPSTGVVFFDPRACFFEKLGITEETFSGGSFIETCLVIPLKYELIGSINIFKKGFEATHRAILLALQEENVDPGKTLTSEKIPYVLNRVQGNMALFGVTAVVVTLGVAAGQFLMDKTIESLAGC